MIINTIKSVLTGIGEAFKRAGQDDRGIGVVEVILILVVLIGLVVIFRDQLTTIVNGIFSRVAEDANAI
jgi:Flp pilus assembly pilin Flp